MKIRKGTMKKLDKEGVCTKKREDLFFVQERERRREVVCLGAVKERVYLIL